MFSRKEEKPSEIKLKFTRPSATYSPSEFVEGKILVTGIKRKINSLGVQALGVYQPNTSNKKVVEENPFLGKFGKVNVFEFEKNLVSDYVVTGTIKKSFKFKMKEDKTKNFPESYYGHLYAVKVKFD